MILDLLSGNYIGVDAEYVPKLREQVRNWPSAEGPDCQPGNPSKQELRSLISSLIQRGILVTHAIPQRPCYPLTCLMELRSGPRTTDLPQIMLRDVVDFSVAWLKALISTRDTKLAALFHRIDRGQRRVAGADRTVSLDEVAALMNRFFRIRLWCYTAVRQCLFDSAVLAHFLTRKHIPCNLVIGVSTKPFAAHAWVQFGTFVLNDTVEHVQVFKPIVQVGHRA